MGRIVVGVDGSAGSRAALGWAVDEAHRRGDRVEAVMAWEDLDVGMWTAATSSHAEADALADRHRRKLDEVVDSTPTSGLAGPVERLFVRGDPSQTLIDVAKGADLVVVGTRGHGSFVGTLLGSVSQRIAAHAPCPVVVVPRPH